MDNRAGEMLIFVTVVEHGSFSAAARTLGLTTSAISKAISRLEQRLGVPLAIRSTRSLRLTAEGQAFLERAQQLLEEMDRLEGEIRQTSSQIGGMLRVSTNIPFAIHVMNPLLAEFLRLHPGVRIDLSYSDETVDLIFDRADLAIRSGDLADSSLIARRLISSSRHVVASPDYLKRNGTPETPADLRKHNCLGLSKRRWYGHWPFRMPGGAIERVEVRGNLLVNQGEGLREFAAHGLGLARLSAFHIRDDLEKGRLVKVLEDFNAGDVEPISVIYSAQGTMPMRTRALLDFLASRLQARTAVMDIAATEY
jgi:DNA-binding transcriptional LysR family regulator